jgi:subtilisin family serine protease
MEDSNQGPQQDDKSSYRQDDKPELRPIEDVLRELGYSPEVIENYSRLSHRDLHLAEIYRLVATGAQNPPNKQKLLNPVQSKVDRKGRIWVDVLLEKKREVSLTELKKIMRVHGKPGRGRFISGRVQAANLPALIDRTVRLQTARPLSPTLDKSLPAIKADKGSLSQLLLPSAPDGHGVIVGIVDIGGCDFYHPNFVKNNKSRLLYLWDQTGRSGHDKPKPQHYDYGVEYSQERINQALERASNSAAADKREVAYTDLDYHPIDKAHGTHVMDIAAGSSAMYPGVAPGADLIYVHIGIPTDPRAEELKDMGSSKFLLDAVQYIFEKANDTPVVINLSLGGNGGSHDGTSVVESAFDNWLKKTGRAIVIAAGNSYTEQLHTSGTIAPNSSPYQIQWVIQDKKNSLWDMRQELEIWYGRNARLKVEVDGPQDSFHGECLLGKTAIKLSADRPTPSVLVLHDQAVPGDDENHISIFIANDDPSIAIGPWKISLSLDTSLPGNDTNVRFEAWIESYAISHSEFEIEPNQPPQDYTQHTLNTIANGEHPIVVGSFDARLNPPQTSYFSSAGPSRNQKQSKKPEFCAPGEDIFAARATDPGGTTKDGTSQAAPHVTGLVALMFQVANPKVLNIQEIREILRETVDPKPAPGSSAQYDPQSGFGRVNAFDALWKIIHP